MCVLSQSHLFIIGNGSDFFGNQASRGGVAYSRRSKIDVNTKSSVMIGNSATETGGAIHLSAANLTFSSGSNTLIQNKALIGGALYASGSIVEVRGQTLVLVNNTVECLYVAMARMLHHLVEQFILITVNSLFLGSIA